MRGLQETRPWLRVHAHRVNQGQSAALAVALRLARGEIIVIMDSDGQNDPADIPALLAAMTPDVDCCCGIRGKRHDTFSKRWASKIGNGVRKLITGGTVTDAGCAFKGVRRQALGEIPVFNGMHRWLATMLEHQGYTVTEIPINHRAREHGVSAYTNLDRALRGLPDCLAMRWYRKRAVRGDRWTPDQD
jgi:dolichol-phosphate mannosyltransferase